MKVKHKTSGTTYTIVPSGNEGRFYLEWKNGQKTSDIYKKHEVDQYLEDGTWILIEDEATYKVGKFKIGDRVISTKDTPSVPEGFIGFITDVEDYEYPYRVIDENEYTELFREDELEILSVSKVTEDFNPREEVAKSALDKQVSGSHYKDFKIQPAEYCHANNVPFLEGNCIKYVSRHRLKNGVKDLEKAIHCLELLIELEYGKDK